jgi:hypothetical protein
MQAEQFKLAQNADARAQAGFEASQADRELVRKREAAVRDAYTSMANFAEELTGQKTAPNVPIAGQPQSGEALVDQPKAEDRLGRALFSAPDILQNPAFLRHGAQALLKAGDPAGIHWLDKLAKAQEEGGIKALQLLAGGDVAGATEEYNRSGKDRINGAIRPGPTPGTYIIPGENGDRTINPREMLRYLRPADALRVAQTGYFEGRNDKDVTVAGVKADGARDVAATRATAAQIIAEAREAGKNARGGTGGANSTAGNVARVLDNADGTRTIIPRNGPPRLLVDDDGKPIMGDVGTKIAAQILKELMKDPANRDPNKPEAARGLADRVMGNKPPAKAEPLPAKQSDAKVGVIYQTARGPAKWNGTAFVPVQ